MERERPGRSRVGPNASPPATSPPGLTFAAQTDNLLIEAEQRVLEAGEEWLPWVEKNCQFSKSQAQRYMLVADGHHKLLETTEKPDELSPTAALRLFRGGSAVAKKKADEWIVVQSEWTKQQTVAGADHVHLADDNALLKFVREQAAAGAHRVLRQTKQRAPTNGESQPIDSATAAVAVLNQIRDALDAALVVRAEPDAGDDLEAPPARRGHNRLNVKYPWWSSESFTWSRVKRDEGAPALPRRFLFFFGRFRRLGGADSPAPSALDTNAGRRYRFNSAGGRPIDELGHVRPAVYHLAIVLIFIIAPNQPSVSWG